MERAKRAEIRCDFNKDVYYFRYPLDRATNREKSITLDRESLIIKY